MSYEVVKGGKKLGDMTVKRMAREHETYYEIDGEVMFRILFSFSIVYKSTSEYQHGKLIKEYTHNQLNDRTRKKSTIWFDGEKYTLDLDGLRSTIKEPITYSVAAVYFEEPSDNQKVYSPQFGKYLTFKKIGEHQYEMESPDGINKYTYTHGICTEVKVFRDFTKFSFVLVPESFISVKEKK